MKFRATSYSMGQVIGQAVVEAPDYRTALRHPKVRALPAGAQGDRGKVRAVGIKVLP